VVVSLSLRHSIIVKQHTSRVKSPDTPQEVFPAGAALVDVEESGTTVCPAEPGLGIGSSLDDDVPPTVTVIVTGVGARRVIR
jgi:hypothetical protein